ncbi:hypothetical protein ACSVIJ_10740 [Pseudomonas sp. NCHU5208]|uniref:hypothetical protein n=1 Tax=unclassified Pseudomonas TaxID=196821 RepID=UPI003F99F9C8
MTSKINVLEIVKGHYLTLKGASGAALLGDYLIFIGLPFIFAALGVVFGLKLSEAQISLLVTFGAIFTALLLSVLVLVYEQENKAHAYRDAQVDAGKTVSSLFELRIELLRELYLNISYSILIALFLILACFLGSVFSGVKVFGAFSLEVYFLTPLALFAVSNLMLTIVMVVKRLHVLLTTAR